MCKYSASSGIVVDSSKISWELNIELNWPIKSPFRLLYFIMKIRLFRVRMIKQFEFLIFDTIAQLIELIWTRQQTKLIFRATTILPCHTMMATFGFSKWIATIVLKEFETDTNIITQERNYIFFKFHSPKNYRFISFKVTAVAWLSSNENRSDLTLVSGSWDRKIFIWRIPHSFFRD